MNAEVSAEDMVTNPDLPSMSANGAANNDSNMPSTSASGGSEPEPSVKTKIIAIKYDEKHPSGNDGMLVFKNEASALQIPTYLLDELELDTKKKKRKTTMKPKKSKRIEKKPKFRSKKYIPSQVYSLGMETIFEDPRPLFPRDIRLLYSFIENNDVSSFSEFIWTFPHLLYCAEAVQPAEHKGDEYNLLQITVLFNAPRFCQLILDILENPAFYKSNEDCPEKMFNILRLYLNSGLNKNGDTPLHYAVEFGLINCCKILLSHPLCETLKKNDEGFTPSDVICMNSGRRSTIEKLQALFIDGLWYVPVFRSNSGLQPFVGTPCECRYFTAVNINYGYSSKEELEKWRTHSLMAFAGPMSYPRAIRFYTALKMPWMSSLFTKEQRNLVSRIKTIEPNRGLERIGRSLAEDWKIEWMEFFPALDVFTNLQTAEGMRLFEKYLESRWVHESHCGLLPSSLVDVETKELSEISLYRPSHVNPLCHRANLLYCYHKKFLKAGVEKIVEEDDVVARTLFAPSTELCRRRRDSDHDIYFNGSSLSELDEEVYMALMQGFSETLYPKVAKWKARIAAELQLKSLEMGNDRNLFKYDPLKPIPIPHPRYL